jgi:hypothetical protein
MYKWIKDLVDAYDKMFIVELPKKPTVYKIGNKRYMLKKRISNSPIKKINFKK